MRPSREARRTARTAHWVLAGAFVLGAIAVYLWPQGTKHLEDLCRRGLVWACEEVKARSVVKPLAALALLGMAALAVSHAMRHERPEDP